MELMQEQNLGYLAVSLGFYKTLFSAPGTSTSSEIPITEQEEMGLTSKFCEASEWCVPVFARPKKDNAIRTVHDFRALNKAIIRKKHTLPRTEDILMNPLIKYLVSMSFLNL